MINNQLHAGKKLILFNQTILFLNSSWQILTFSPRIVVFIRICGTHNTANEVFHCVHFECPCQADVLKLHMNEESSSSSMDEDNVKYEEFSKYYEQLIDPTDKESSSSIVNNNSLIGTYTILPFMIKSNSSLIFHNEQENDPKN